MIPPTTKRFARRLLFTASLVALALLASGCVVPTPGPASKLPANYAAQVGLTIGPIQYGPDPVQLLDLYLPAPSQRPAPVILFLHSGGFVGGNRSAVSQAIQREVLRGYAVASVEYHLSPAVQFPVALQDVKTAIRWAKAGGSQYGLRPDEAFVAGYSAGGNLAAMAALTPGQFEPTNLPPDLAAQDSRVRGAITMSGVLSLNDTASVPGWGPAFVGQYVGSLDPTAMATASPVNYVTPSSPPMYIAQGVWDGLCRPVQSGMTMAHRYAGVGRATVAYYDAVKNQGHNLDLDGMNVTVFDFWLDAVRDGRIA
jgi:acetyl esterase/lipase